MHACMDIKFLVKCTVEESRAFQVKCLITRRIFQLFASLCVFISISLVSMLKSSHAPPEDSKVIEGFIQTCNNIYLEVRAMFPYRLIHHTHKCPYLRTQLYKYKNVFLTTVTQWICVHGHKVLSEMYGRRITCLLGKMPIYKKNFPIIRFIMRLYFHQFSFHVKKFTCSRQ